MYDVRKAINGQDKFIVKNKLPRYTSFNGVCVRCKRNIYEIYHWVERGGIRKSVKEKFSESVTGISVRKASEEHIKDCPHCFMKFDV